MPGTESRRPRAATCEDWDEDRQTTLPGTHTTANVAVKRSQPELKSSESESNGQQDGGDAGRATRADPVASESGLRRKMTDLKLDTGIVERERQPYRLSSGRPYPTRRESSSRFKDARPTTTPTTPAATATATTTDYSRPAQSTYFVHERGICWVCDQYGKHVDVQKEVPRSSSTAPPAASSQTSRPAHGLGSKDEDAIRPKARRSSSTRQSRPVTMYAPSPTQMPYATTTAIYATPVLTTPAWPTSVAASLPFGALPYSYVTPAVTTPTFPPFHAGPPYYEPTPVPDARPPKPNRQSSSYGDPIIQHAPGNATPGGLQKVVSSADSRPALATHKSSNRGDQGRSAMPPPPRPPAKQQAEIIAHRPSNKRRPSTYYTAVAPRNDPDDEDAREFRHQPAPAVRSHQQSPSRPPSSYRGPPVPGARERPHVTRKPASYSTPTSTTKVASSNGSQGPPRRSTLPTTLLTTTLEHKEAEAEAYQRKRGLTTDELAAEKLREFNKHSTSSSLSETGSSYSHKSRQSSSKDSSGREKSNASAGNTNITIDGISVSIPADYTKEGRPISLSLGSHNLIISTSSKDRDEEPRREQRRIERPPSVASRTSRRSITSSVVSSKGKERDIPDGAMDSSRRLSYVEDQRPSMKSSLQPSRAPSSSRHSVDYSRRPSVDYGVRDEPAVYGA